MSDDSSNRIGKNNNNAPENSKAPKGSWGPVSAVLVAGGAFIGAQALALSALIAIGFFFGGLPETWASNVSGQFYFVLLSDLFILLIIWAFLRSRGADWRNVGFRRGPKWLDLGFAGAGYVVYFVLSLVAVAVAGYLTNINLEQQQEHGFDVLLSNADKIMAFISLVVLPPLVEEIVFRGFVFTGLRKKLTFVWATLITSVLFAAPHLLASSVGLLWVAGLDTLVLSFVLCYLRERTGALWAPIAVHAFKNGLAFVILLGGGIGGAAFIF